MVMAFNIMLCLLVGLFPIPVAAQGLPLDRQTQSLLEPQAKGAVNWTDGTIVARGFGVPPPNVAAAAATTMAGRAAIAVAQRNLLEVIQGIHVDAETVVEKLILKKDEVNMRVRGVIRDATILERQIHSDGSVELKLSMQLWGQGSLASTLLKERTFAQSTVSPNSAGGGYTSVVLDTKGLRVKPAMFPKVVDEVGQLVYGPSMVSLAAAEGYGLAQYALGEEKYLARYSESIFYAAEKKGSNSKNRVGARPLRIKGLQKLGTFNANIMISNADAKKSGRIHRFVARSMEPK